ncbi:hypothetical protein Q7P35_003659 [Cladosporium inversicolor]
MSVLLETSAGDITIDLLVKEAPKCCENFLKLCKAKYYNFSPVYNVQPNFSFQTGDPIGPEAKGSDGGASIWSLPDGATKRPTHPDRMTFKPEISKKRKHSERGTVSMATSVSKINPDDRFASSQFIITLGENIEDLDGKAAIFGEVVEGFDALEKINTAFIDNNGRPLQDIRILHTVVLDDPYDDPPGFIEPPSSPLPSDEQRATVRIAYDEVLEENTDPEKLEKVRREREARAQALTLELIGDLPSADITPPEQILFVCKLNPVTRDEDLELIFSRFGKILSCEVIRDKASGDSLQYAFIEFATKEDCERAYFKMQGVLIDDHRIHVDFSQTEEDSVESTAWNAASSTVEKREAVIAATDMTTCSTKKSAEGVANQTSLEESLVAEAHLDETMLDTAGLKEVTGIDTSHHDVVTMTATTEGAEVRKGAEVATGTREEDSAAKIHYKSSMSPQLHPREVWTESKIDAFTN